MKNSKSITPVQLGTVYVGGPIQYALMGGRFDPTLRRLLHVILTVLGEHRYRVLSAHLVEEFGAIDMQGMAAQVTIRDFNWIADADAYVCILPAASNGLPFRSDGTCIELGWASALDKRIVIIRDKSLTYTHLIEGLHSVARATYLDVDTVLEKPTSLLASLRAPATRLAGR